MLKKLTAAGCIFWIAGLAAFITGLNLTGTTGGWVTTIGSIVFMIGLGITGAVWFKKKKDEEKTAEDKTGHPQ